MMINYVYPFTLDSAKSKIDKLAKITNWLKKQTAPQLSITTRNGHTLGFRPKNQKLESFVSPKVSLWEGRNSLLSTFAAELLHYSGSQRINFTRIYESHIPGSA